ncbi:hypothetical protein Tco_1129785, partial [Tanacetum coccineum]
ISVSLLVFDTLLTAKLHLDRYISDLPWTSGGILRAFEALVIPWISGGIDDAKVAE